MINAKTLSDFMGSPQREECKGRLLSAARQLELSGYKHRHISMAAVNVALHHARQQEASEFRFNLEFIERLVRSQIELLDQTRADWEARGCPAEG